jgi:hypothetical protein
LELPSSAICQIAHRPETLKLGRNLTGCSTFFAERIFRKPKPQAHRLYSLERSTDSEVRVERETAKNVGERYYEINSDSGFPTSGAIRHCQTTFRLLSDGADGRECSGAKSPTGQS